MTYEFQCSTVYGDCDEVIEGETEDEVMEEVETHMREHHGLIELPPDMAKRVLASVDPRR
ncbi:MAG: DUF1059 domain-containing protein [Actinomycetota bacterium]